MKLRTLALVATLLLPTAAPAAENPEVVKAMEEYMDFNEYGSSLIWPEQIPTEDWKKVAIIDARDAAQYAKEHIPPMAGQNPPLLATPNSPTPEGHLTVP